jgi:hypothetical protein
MQNDLRCPISAGLALDALEGAFQRSHAHARAAAPHRAPPTSAPHDARADPASGSDSDGERLLDGAELLRAAREPIEWLLTLAQRLAVEDADEVAAIDRLRAAFHAQLAGRPIGVRRSDVLIAFALLVGALDPAIVLPGIARTIADGVTTILTCEGVSLAAELARVAQSLPGIRVYHARVPRRRRCPSTNLSPL